MDVLLTETQREFDAKKFKMGLEMIEKHTPKGKILDIGCATGHFLEIAKSGGWNETGMELNNMAVAHCKKNGINIIQSRLNDNTFPESSFEAVTLWDVLEHIDNPGEVIGNAYKILKQGGILLIVVPNVNSIAAKIMHDKCNVFAGHAHVNMFSPQTLSKFLEGFGFNILHKETLISELNVLNNYIEYQNPYLGQSENRQTLFGSINEKFIHDNLLGYKILMIAKK